uniref:Uncharacterized protein n=1 Tax=Plectus sambesii TaxID=2011161 RepID=A0A914UTU5_9BILA
MVSAIAWVFIAIAIAILLALIALIVYANLPTKYTLGAQAADYDYLSKAPLTKLEGWVEGGQKTTIPAAALWKDSGILLMVVRRPG